MAAVPRIKLKLKILAPIILLIDKSVTCFFDEVSAVTNSGKEVPTATTVKPIINDGTPNAVAIAVPELTRSQLPDITNAIPIIK